MPDPCRLQALILDTSELADAGADVIYVEH